MDQVKFLEAVLPDLESGSFGQTECYYGLLLKKSPDGKPERRQRLAYSREELAQFLREGSAQGWDAYMALSSFTALERGRKAVNARREQCMWADIDVGKAGCRWQTREEALAGLLKFAKGTGLKPTVLVSSGMGWHAYWRLTKPLPTAEWKELAKCFGRLFEDEGMDVDPARTCDAASVLRLPGTLHQKSGRTVEVALSTLASYDPDELKKNFGWKPVDFPLSPPSAPKPEALAGFGLGGRPPSGDGRLAVASCRQLREMGSQSYPNWFHAMSVLKRFANGLELAHELSSGDPRYDPAGTEEKFGMAADDMPATCETFRLNAPELCEGCAYAALVKSPVQTAKLAPPLQIKNEEPLPATEPADNGAAETKPFAIPDWTAEDGTVELRFDEDDAYDVSPAGMQWKHWTGSGKKAVEKTDLLCHARVRYVRGETFYDETMRPLRAHVFDVEQQSGARQQSVFVVSEHAGPQATMTWCLNSKVIPLNPAYNGSTFMGMINAYLAKVAARPGMEREAYRKLGWQNVTSRATGEQSMGFVLPCAAFTRDGMQPAALMGPAGGTTAEAYSAKGALEKWKFLPKMYRALGQQAGMLCMCLSFAAPLMRWGGADAANGIFSLYSRESGLGKSWCLKSAASVWGNPAEALISQSASTVARCRKMAAAANLPAMHDELTEMSPEDLANLVYILAAGQEKQKLKSSGDEFIRTGEWSTVSFVTSNKSLKDKLAAWHVDTEATVQRILEWQCDFRRCSPDSPEGRLVAACQQIAADNYGLAGPEFMFRLMERPERLHSLQKTVAEWFAAKSFRQQERFTGRMLGIAMLAGRWACEWGLLDYDMDALEKWVLDVLVPYNREMNREFRIDDSGTFGDFLDTLVKCTLVVRHERREENEPDPQSEFMPDRYVLVRPKGDLLAWYCPETGRLRVAKTAFTSWCRAKNLSPKPMLAALRGMGMDVKETKACLGAHVSIYPAARVRVYEMDRKTLDMLGYDAPAEEEA